jgi:tRNA A58 N-methylase Trm61
LGLHWDWLLLPIFGNQSKITTLEGCAETAKIAQNQFRQFGLTNVNSVTTEFKNYLKNSQLSIINYQLIYFDGNHSKTP